MNESEYIQLDRKLIYHLRSIEAAALIAYLKALEADSFSTLSSYEGYWFVAKMPDMVEQLGIGLKRVRRNLRNLRALGLIDNRYSHTYPSMLEYRINRKQLQELFG